MKAGGRLLAAHIFFDRDWTVKGTTEWPPERVAADNAFMAENPHAAAVGERLRSYHDIFAKPKKARRRRANPTNGGAHIG